MLTFRNGILSATALIICVLLISIPAVAQTNLLIAQADGDMTDEPPTLLDSLEAVDVSTSLPDLTLSEAIDMALSDNNNIEMARQAVDIARASGRSALTQFLPDLSMAYVYTRLGDANVIEVPDVGEFVLQPENSFFWGLTFKYPLYNGGQDTATRRSSDAETRGAEYRLDEAEDMIRLSVTGAFMGILQMQAGLDAARASRNHLDEVVRTSQALYDEGYLPLSDLLSVQVAQSRAIQSVAELERNLEVAQSSFAILIGGDITDRWNLVPVEYPESDIPYDLDTLWDWALSTRSELKEIDTQRESVEAQMAAIRSSRNPRVSLQADYSRSGSDLFPDDSTVLQGTVSIFWDLYDFGRADDLLAPLEERMGLLDTQYDDMQNQVRQEVESALLDVRTQLGNLEVSRQARAQAREAYRVASRRLEEGLGLTLGVLNAEADLSQTDAGYYSVLYSYYRAIATLARTVGMTTDDLVVLISTDMEEE
jgi:outer membrane protein TolC